MIDSDVGLMVRLVIVFPGITMNMVRKNFDKVLGVIIKKLNAGQKNDELAKRYFLSFCNGTMPVSSITAPKETVVVYLIYSTLCVV